MNDTETLVIEDIRKRQEKGIAKYGTTVAQNPLTHAQWLQHTYEEALDMQFNRPLGAFAILYRTEEMQKPPIFEMPNFKCMSREDANRIRMRDWYWAKKAGFKHLADYYRDKVESSLAAHGKVKWE